MHAPRSIVIVKLSAIGDVLHGVPVAVALKRAFPDARIGWAVEGRAADVLAGHPAVDHLFRLMKSAVVSLASGARTRIGHARPEAREGAWLVATHPVTVTAAHVVDRNLGLLEPLGVAADDPSFDMPRWPVSRLRMERWAMSLRLPRPPVLLNPGAGWASKRWPVDRFAAMASEVSRRDGQPVVVLWGGDQERAAAGRIVAASGGGAIAAPRTSLQDLGELVGTPCVGIFGPVPARRNGPYGRRHVCVEPPPSARPRWRDRKTDMAAIAAIDVDAVIAATETALAESRAA